MMKKIALFTALTAFMLTSCKDDDHLRDDGAKDLLLGKWNMVKGEIYENGVLSDSENLSYEGCEYNYYEFNDDGTWSYNLVNKQITLVDAEDGYRFIAEIISMTDTDLKIKIISDGGDKPGDSGLEIYYFLEK